MSLLTTKTEKYAHNKTVKRGSALVVTLFFEGKCVMHWGRLQVTPCHPRVAPLLAPWGTQCTGR